MNKQKRKLIKRTILGLIVLVGVLGLLFYVTRPERNAVNVIYDHLAATAVPTETSTTPEPPKPTRVITPTPLPTRKPTATPTLTISDLKLHKEWVFNPEDAHKNEYVKIESDCHDASGFGHRDMVVSGYGQPPVLLKKIKTGDVYYYATTAYLYKIKVVNIVHIKTFWTNKVSCTIELGITYMEAP